MVFYRKYRPQTIDNLDSTSVRETLHSVLQKDIPHAFLFTGPKGLGKTSTARIVAKVVNCEKRKKGSVELCGDTCDQCRSITNGTNIDVLEIDAASNRGIDEIRELKEKIRLAPVASHRKVYIIDEVHMLTTEAFNALLKTLEEPPEHAMFILCTTEAHKVPDTIVSRCFQIMFRSATDEEIARSLQRIIDGEKIKIDKGVLRVIAQTAEGGFRDAAKMLEELSLIANGSEITRELIEQKYHTTQSTTSAGDLIRYVKEKDAKAALTLINELTEQGIDLKFFIGKVLNYLHEFLLMKNTDVTTNIGSNENTLVTLDNGEIINLFELFSKAYQDMKYAVLPQLPLEIAVIEWCESSQNSIQTTPLSNTTGAQPAKSYVAQDTEVSVNSLRKQVGTIKKLKALYGTPANPQVSKEDEVVVKTASVELLHTSGDGSVTKEWMEVFWRSLIDEMKKYNHTVAGVLRGCTIKNYADQKLIIQTSYAFHKERLDDMKNHDSLMKVSKLLTGKDIAITVELKK